MTKHTQLIFVFGLLAIMLFPMRTAAQMPIKFDVVEQQAPDSVDVADSEKKNFWRASGTVFGFNWLLWGYDRYIRKGDFAHISLNSV